MWSVALLWAKDYKVWLDRTFFFSPYIIFLLSPSQKFDSFLLDNHYIKSALSVMEVFSTQMSKKGVIFSLHHEFFRKLLFPISGSNSKKGKILLIGCLLLIRVSSKSVWFLGFKSGNTRLEIYKFRIWILNRFIFFLLSYI